MTDRKGRPTGYELFREKARKDRSDRRRLLEKAERLLRNPSQIKSDNKRGGKKYLRNMVEEPEWILDEDAVERDALFDGYYAIQTSALDMTAIFEKDHPAFEK